MPSKAAWERLHAIEGLVKIPKLQPSRKWIQFDNEERNRAIISALRAGADPKDLVDQFNVTRSRIYQIGHREGVDLAAQFRARQKIMHQKRRIKVHALEAKNVPVASIARILGVSPETIRAYTTQHSALGAGIRRWWADKTPEERTKIMAERQAKRSDGRGWKTPNPSPAAYSVCSICGFQSLTTRATGRHMRRMH